MKIFQKYLGIAAISSAALIGSANSYAISADWIEQSIKSEEKKLGARIGVAIIDEEAKQTWSYRGNERFPINSTHKAYLCAAILAKVDNDKISLDDTTTIHEKELVFHSPVVETLLSPKTISNRQLCQATLTYSDNAAANKLVEVLGGIEQFNLFMRSLGDPITRLDRKEPELNEGTPGDDRDTTTPLAAATSLREIFFGSHLSSSSKAILENWMANDKVANDLLRKNLPTHWRISDKTGAGGYGSRSIVAIIYPTNKKPLIISIYITETYSTISESNEAIAKIGLSLFEQMNHSKPRQSQ